MSLVEHSKAPPPSPAAPRLRVIHFLLWMLGCGAAMTGYRVFTQWNQVQAEDLPFLRVLHLGMGMAYGVGVVTLYVWVESLRRRDGAFPSQPGHWLLLLGVATAALDGATTLFVRCVLARWLDPWEEWHVIQWIGWGAGAIVLLAFLFAPIKEWRWRLPIAVGLALAASRSVLLFLVWRGFRNGRSPFAWETPARWEAAGIALAVLALAAAAATDLVYRQRRDWLHWLGVAVCLALAAAELANGIKFFFLA
jgi:hypothetical protein